tara:strand:+ start:1547 stop:2365 length:819 start_codon:yes stop_codon:yes gene_type:complete
MNRIKLKDFFISNDLPFVLIAGPCALENKNHAFEMIEEILEITTKLKINFIFKTSFDKANRTNIKSERGTGIQEAVNVFKEIKNKYNCPILTDIHNESQIPIISEVVDIIQIPAFLCRQTDLIVNAAKTKKIINIKKGQFLSPYEVPEVINKITSSGNTNVILTERGYSFGYNNLITDFRSLEIMKKTNFPVIFDATHSVQEPGLQGSSSGGRREFIPTLSKAAIAVGIAGIFVETHNDPDNAPSDGPNMLPLNELKNLLIKLIEFDKVAKS